MTDIACVVEARNTLGECCLWCPATKRLWWIDIQRPCLQSYDPASRAHRVYPLPGRFCGCAALRKSGGLILALDDGLHHFDPAIGKLELLVQAEHVPGNRYNDGRCDRRGRLWIGTMDIDIKRPSGSFYRIGADRSVQPLFNAVTVPNSTAFSPDDGTLYFADTPCHVIWAFDFDIEAGAISNRRVFADLSGRKAYADGSCIDAEGFLWNAEYGGRRLTRYAPDGRVDRSIELPVTYPTCCCFGGDKLDTLYVTSAMPRPKPGGPAPSAIEGGVLALDVGVRGLPEAAFGG
jgi:sugar lactone lactonase YvrE